MKEYLFSFTESEALQLGLLRCVCGHPKNNHFEWGSQPCAHCVCDKYRPVARVGILYKEVEKE